MARPSKLTPEQWQAVEGRFAAGETASALARDFGVDEAAIRRKFRRDTPKVREVAEKLAAAQTALAELPKHQQPVAIGLADQLQAISASALQAARHGADTSAQFAAVANRQAHRFVKAMDDAGEEADPMEHQEKLQAISALTKISNDAMVPALALIKANQGGAKDDEPARQQQEVPTPHEFEAIMRRMATEV